MNPHFFSYGTVIIYLIYFTKLIFINLSPFLIGRFYSALFSSLTIFVIFQISRFILEKKYALAAAFLAAITPGLIQQAHFTTPESSLTFFISSSLLFLLTFIKHSKIRYLILTSIFLGLALGTKIVAGLFLPVFFLGLFLKFWKLPTKLVIYLLLCLATTLLTLLVTSPFIFLDYPDWRSNFNYENSVANGSALVFYTRQFINTSPIFFQAEKILPYTLSPLLLIFSILGIIISIFQLFRKFRLDVFVVLLTFLFLFLPNSFLFAKWTRFIAPTFPFFSIFAAFGLQQLKNKFFIPNVILSGMLLIPTAIWSLAFFSIYLNHDIRISADKWLRSATPLNSSFLVEGGNTIDLPLSSAQKKSIDFYSLEENPQTRTDIAQGLETSDYFIVESRRVFSNHQRLPNLYPKTSHFYTALFNGQLGFEEIKQFNSYPSIPFFGSGLEIPDENAEETWSVFDHPVIRVFKKRVDLTRTDYEKFF